MLKDKAYDKHNAWEDIIPIFAMALIAIVLGYYITVNSTESPTFNGENESPKIVAEIESIHTEMPPGYSLQKDMNSGLYRPLKENGRPLFWLNGKGTKQEAINRAWGQYDYENNLAKEEWVDYE